VLKFHKGDELCRKEDFVDYFGILMHGAAFVLVENRNMKNLKIGDMIGQNFAADFTTVEQHMVTVIAATDGLLACVPFGEIKAEIRKQPDAIFKIYQIASKNAMETFMFNSHGVEHNPAIQHNLTYSSSNKKVRDFLAKNPKYRTFLALVEKKDEKSITQAYKGVEFEAGDRITKSSSWDRSLLIVCEGDLIHFTEEGVN